MKHQNTSGENRRHPRIKRRIQFKLKARDFVVVTETINLSCIGAYCQVKENIPFMTRLKIVFALPCSNQKKKDECVECCGVVVRVEKVLSESNANSVLYNIAIFFNEIEESERKKLANFIEKMS